MPSPSLKIASVAASKCAKFRQSMLLRTGASKDESDCRPVSEAQNDCDDGVSRDRPGKMKSQPELRTPRAQRLSQPT
ncbi:hypothetical protein B1812_20145 [Methylocystis bryophila]|uniref:Uncharacterized protein n=1 Tax=Methylocystis bryophila TaxID=655015 RepID=A0A1W6MZL3_9HYPH|nr:hypothetical protein B1812_20145 [Methylocystis bryophila]